MRRSASPLARPRVLFDFCWLLAILLVFPASGLHADADDREIQALERDARSRRPEVRVEAFRKLLLLGEEGKPVLREVLEGKISRDLRDLNSLLRSSHFAHFRRRVQALLGARREAALDLILDRERYPDEAHGSVAQPQVDEVVDALREVYERPVETLRADVPELDELIARLDEDFRFGSAVGLEVGEYETMKDLLRSLNRAVHTEAMVPPEILRANEEVARWNDEATTVATEAELEVIRLTNRYRQMLGLHVLEVDDRLVLAARGHSQEMQDLDYFAHVSPVEELKTPTLRARREGYSGRVSENCAIHQTPQGAFSGWYRSSGHHRNLIAANHRQIGVGVSENGRYWTMVPGSGDSLRGKAKPDPRQVYLRMAARLQEGDATEHYKLALWCRRYGLAKEAEEELRKVVAIDPDHRDARRLLGHVQLDGRWVERGDPQRLEGRQALEALKRMAASGVASERKRAAELFASEDEARALPLLLSLLEDRASEVRAEAARSLGALSGARATGALLDRLGDADFFVRHEVALALRRLGRSEGVRVLIDDLGSENLNVRIHAHQTLREMGAPSLGYAWDLPLDQRREAIDRFRAWWETSKE